MDILLNESQVARILNYSCHWLRAKRCKGGGPPYVKLGHAVRYRESELDDWINRHPTLSHTSQTELPAKKRTNKRLHLSPEAIARMG